MDKYAAEHILNLTGEYDARKLKAAFHELAAIHHPDAAEARGLDRSASTSKMQEINEANDYLQKLLALWGPTLSCEEAPAPADDPQRRGMTWAPPVKPATAAYNPFEGRREGGPDRRKRTSTAEYYWNDPRYQSNDGSTREHTGEAVQTGPTYYNGEYESFSGKPQPEPTEDPARPFPKWYLPVWRFFAIFPYRFVFLFLICLLVNMTDPLGASAKLGIMSFEDMLILLAIVNLVKPFLTGPVRAGMLWLVDRARDLAWKIKGL